MFELDPYEFEFNLLFPIEETLSSNHPLYQDLQFRISILVS